EDDERVSSAEDPDRAVASGERGDVVRIGAEGAVLGRRLEETRLRATRAFEGAEMRERIRRRRARGAFGARERECACRDDDAGEPRGSVSPGESALAR